MRLLLLLLLCAVGTIAGDLHERFLGSPNYYAHLDIPKEHIRVKRAAVSGSRVLCDEGWTGSYCENPICNDHETLHADDSDGDKDVDTLHLPENCEGQYYVPFDSTTDVLTITVTTVAGKPVVQLTDDKGHSPSPSVSHINEGRSQFMYSGHSGSYVMTVDTQGVPTKHCIAHIQANSKLSINAGFVASPFGDHPPFGESGDSTLPNYFITHAFNLASPGVVNTVTIRSASSYAPIYRSLLTRRYDCAYEFYAGEFSCTPDESYIYSVDGIDDKGKAFRRSRIFYCYQPILSSTPAAPSTPAVTHCLNGGSLLTDSNNGTSCFCTDMYMGKQCENAVCMNGGLPLGDDSSMCDCVPGFHGTHCTEVNCSPNVGKILTDDKTLSIVIRNSKSMTQHIAAITKAIDDEVLHNMVEARNPYQDFILSFITDGVVTTRHYSFQQLAFFLQDVENLNNTYSTTASCSDKIMPALGGIYYQIRNKQSPVFIFTDAISDQSDFDSFRQLMSANSEYGLHIHTFYMRTNPGCTVDLEAPGLNFYHHIARFTAGLVHAPTKDNLHDIFVGSMRASTYRMNLVESGDLKQCAVMKAVIIDASAKNLSIIATGYNLSMTLTDPNWQVQLTQPYFTDGNSYFWHIENPLAGEYLYSITSSDPNHIACSYRIFTESDFDLFVGTTDNIDDDSLSFEPVVGQPSHIVAQLNGFYGNVQDPSRLFSEILITSPDEVDKHQPLYYSNGIYRSDCGYHLYFGVAAFCQYEDQIFYVTVFADDGSGNPVQRSSVGYCKGGPTPKPPGDQCENGGVSVNGTTCWCPAHFSGDRCQRISCQNGGSPREDGESCMCPFGLTGRFCELMQCSQQDQQFDSSPDHRSMTFIISVRKSMQATAKLLADKVIEFARNFAKNTPNWITRFNVIIVSQTKTEKFVASNTEILVKIFANIRDNFQNYTEPNNNDCPVLINQALSQAISVSFANSPIFVFADSPAVTTNLTTILELMNRADDLHIQINLFGTSADMCDGSGTFGDTESGVAQFTGGKVLYATKIDRVFTYIASLYKSSVITEKQSTSCDTGMDFYFPLDSLSHSLTITVQGTAPLITVIAPDGSQKLYVDRIIDDDKLLVEEYLQACDNDWDNANEYCLKYDNHKSGWLAGLVTCATSQKDGARLVDILTKEKHDAIKDGIDAMPASVEGVWIGLTKDKDGVWKWLQYDLDPVPLTPTIAQYWAPGQDFNNPAYVYAYMKKDGLFYVATTEDQHYVVCEKDRYNGMFNPSSEPDIPPGFWNVAITTTSQNCSVQVRTQSDIQVFYGFVTDQHDDFSRGTLNIDSSSNFVIATAVGLGGFTENVQTPEGRIDYAIVGTASGDVDALAMTERGDCTFDSIAKQGISCPVSEPLTDVTVKFRGIDQFGYPFERYAVTRCDKLVLFCFNGGFLHNGECVCTNTHYAGVDCGTILCENGGKSQDDGTCLCPASYTGQFCELPICDPPYPAPFPVDHRTLSILIETSFEMTVPLFYLRKHLYSGLVNLTQSRPGWFNNFYYYPFDSAKNRDKWLPHFKTTELSDINDAMDNLLPCDDDTGNCSTDCPRPITSVLLEILKDPSVAAPDSVIVVITRAAIEDHTLYSELLPLLMSKRVHLHFVLAGTSSPCSAGWNNPMNEMMQTYASFSVGSVNSIAAKNVPDFFEIYLPALYKSQDVVMDTSSRFDCANKEFVFQIDHSTKDFTVEVYGAEVAKITLNGPNGGIVLPPNAITSNIEYIGVFQVDNNTLVPGTYVAKSGNTGNYCNVRVRASSTIQITPGFTQINDGLGGATQDNAHFAPLMGQKNGIVLHAEGLKSGTIEFVQIVTPRGNIFSSRDVNKRDNACTYEFFATGDFDCDFAEFELVVYGVDNNNSPFHRNFKGHCVDERPVPVPPEPTCDLAGIKADVTFLMDSSAADNKTINWFRLLTLSLTSRMAVDANGVQIAAMTVSNQAEKGGFFTFLAGNNKSSLTNSLGTLYADGGKGQDIGQGVLALLKDIYDPAKGYRKDPKVKKLLVYLTSTEPTDKDPTNAFDTLENTGATGVAMITYDVKNPSDKLLGLVEERCRYVADSNNFINSGTRFIQNLLCARRQVCGL